MSNTTGFQNKVVLVTGASGGIGRGIAMEFAREGADVVAHYHSQQAAASSLVTEITTLGRQALALSADLTRPEQVAGLFQSVKDQFGRLDVLVNNAGLYLESASILDMSPDDWKKLIDADLNSVFICTQEAGRIMSAQPEGGVILNISSVEALFPVKGHSYYNVAKAGMNMFTRSTAQEMGSSRIRVNTISPGLIWKEGLEESWPDGVRSWQRNAPLGSLGMPEDIANACVFLASEKARWITGANLVVDGGYSSRVIH